MHAEQRIITTLNHEEPDKIPSFEGSIDNIEILNHYGQEYNIGQIAKLTRLFYYLFLGSEKRLSKFMIKAASGSKGAKLVAKSVLDIYSSIGIDLAPAALLELFPHHFHKNGFIDEFGRKMEYKVNPADGMTLLYYMGGFLKDFESYDAFPKPDPDDPIRENMFKAAKELEKEYKGNIFAAPAIGGMMEVTWEGFGLENFSRLLTNRKEIKQIFDDRGRMAVEMVKRIVEWGERSGPLIIYDDYGYKKGLFMSPKNYRTYVLPWLKQVCGLAHKSGIKILLHSCGDISQIFEDIVKCGVDAINPIEPTTANPEYDIFKLNEKYGDRITFVGNVSPQDLADKDPLYIETYTKRLIKELGPNGGFILASGHSINPAVKLNNFLAMRETLEKYGKYPINVN
jgi:hypothetical protein